MESRSRWTHAGAALMGAMLLLGAGCSGKPKERSCLDENARAAAVEYVRTDLMKFFPADQAATMDGAGVTLESVAVQSRDEAKGETTCSATLTYHAGEANLSVPVAFAWAPAGREGEEYWARIWPVGTP